MFTIYSMLVSAIFSPEIISLGRKIILTRKKAIFAHYLPFCETTVRDMKMYCHFWNQHTRKHKEQLQFFGDRNVCSIVDHWSVKGTACVKI